MIKYELDDEKTTLTIYHEDLAKWFNETPNNYNYNRDHEVAKVTPGKETEFAHYILKKMLDDAPYEADDYVWTEPLTYAFNELLEDYKPELLTYYEDSESDDDLDNEDWDFLDRK